MIGFGHQDVVRRPIYSATGTKLGYIVSGPDGDWWTSIKGKRLGRIKQFRRPQLPDATAAASGGTYISPSEIDG